MAGGTGLGSEVHLTPSKVDDGIMFQTSENLHSYFRNLPTLLIFLSNTLFARPEYKFRSSSEAIGFLLNLIG